MKKIEKINNSENLEKKFKLQEEIIRYTPGGMHVCYLNEPIHLDYASEGLANLLGYTKEEFDVHTKDKYINNIVEEDRSLFIEFSYKIAESLSKSSLEYRMIKKDGSIICVLDTMEAKLCIDGVVRGYSSVVDITELKEVEQKYRNWYHKAINANKRFKELLKFSGILFFEYDRDLEKYINVVNFKDITGYTKEEYRQVLKNRKIDNCYKYTSDTNYEKILEEMYYFTYHDDSKIVEQCIEDLQKEKGFKREIRLLCADNKYHWFEVEMHILENSENVIIGFIRNIDNSIYDREMLKQKIGMDLMTGLKNKVTAFSDISKYINSSPDTLNAFLFLDIDDFKEINDNLGHKIGDEVIKFLASNLSFVFRKNDIIARFGGDEFMVFMKDINNKDIALKHAEKLSFLFEKCPLLKDTGFKTSISIGISFIEPEEFAGDIDTKIYNMLIEADEMLYKSKISGKGQYKWE